jgi:AcrR family transcriptional regulator
VPGRPRDRDLEKRLVDAAWHLLASHGYDALTMTKVATEAGAHRTDVYRRWSSKVQLVVDVLDEHLPSIRPRDTGSLSGDIRSYVDCLAASWSAPWMDGLVGALADLRQDPDAELAFAGLAGRRGQAMRDALHRAVARGELAELPDMSLVGDLIEGPLMHRRLIGRQPLTPEYLERLAAATHGVLAARKPAL